MPELAFQALLSGTGYDLPVTSGEMLHLGDQILLMNYQSGERLNLSFGANDVTRAAMAPQARVAVSVPGQAGSLDSVLIEALSELATGDSARAVASYLGLTPVAADAVLLLPVETAAGPLLYAALPGGAGLSILRIEADGSLGHLGQLGDSDARYGAGISCMARITLGGSQYLVTGSALEDGIDVYRIGAGGGLTAVDSVGVEQMLPVQGVTALQAVTLNGQGFLVVGAAGSSSLTVLAMGSDGSLAVADHVVDGLDTRFAGITRLEAVEAGGSVYLLASGSDGGISLLTLTPDGHLVHLDALADDTDSALAGITALTARVIGEAIEILAASGCEGGLSRIRVDLEDLGQGAGLGAVTGGAGEDILVDGAGQQTLTGGDGADLFVLAADGAPDVIADFDPNTDRLDLSQWAFLYTTGQIAYEVRPDGGRLVYGDETLVLHTADGSPLTAEDFAALSVVSGLAHYEVTLGTAAPPPPAEDPSGGAWAGGSGDDMVMGSMGDDTLSGGAGNDTLRGFDGNDVFDGGAGHDIASYADATRAVVLDMVAPGDNAGAAQGDSFSGIEGVTGSTMADRLAGSAAANSLDGGRGNDFLDGRGGDDTILGGQGNDSLLGRDGNDSLDGGDNHDNFAAGAGDDTAHGGPGNDSMGGGEGDDSLYGDTGNDVIGAGTGDDLIEAGDNHDVASGGYGADIVRGGLGDDTLAGSFGDDTVDGGAGDDSLGGGLGRDAIWGRAGDDVIGAGGGDDLVWGGDGFDFLAGAAGQDALDGGMGNDTLNGGADADTLTGGEGADVFVFGSGDAGGLDRITDFVPGEDRVLIRDGPGGFSGFTLTEGDGFVELTAPGFAIRFEGLAAGDLHASDFLFV